jgi:Domain of unknown function DUF29
MPVKSLLYDRDFFAWSLEQAELLRAGKLAHADIEHIAEEIDSMGRTEKREPISRLSVLLARRNLFRSIHWSDFDEAFLGSMRCWKECEDRVDAAAKGPSRCE